MPLNSKWGRTYTEVNIEDNTEIAVANLKEVVKESLHKIGVRAVEHSRGYETAIDTGRLNRSICTWSKGHPVSALSYEISTNREYYVNASTDEEGVVYIGTNVEYGIFIEVGSSIHNALHYLARAAHDHMEEYRNMLENDLRDGG